MIGFREPIPGSRILMRPICENCHHVFELDEVYLMSIDHSDPRMSYERPWVMPTSCPNCKAYLGSIEFPIQWIWDFGNNVYREELK